MELLDPNLNENNKKINFKKEIFKILKHWPWIVLSVIVFYLGSYFYLKYTQPQYLSKTSLLFQESENDKGALGDLKNLGMGVSGDDDLQGEAAIIVSKPIITSVVKKLNLDVSFFAKGRIREIELYDNSPYFCKILHKVKDFSGVSYYIEPVNENSFRLSEGPLSNSKNTFRYGETVIVPWGSFIITRNKQGYPPYKNLMVINDTKSVANQLENAISVKLPGGLLMDVSLEGAVPAKSEDILNELTTQFNVDGINDKNIEASNTAKFIDARLDLISRDLSIIEADKENFKKANEITDLDVQAGVAVNRLSTSVENVYSESAKLEVVNALYSIAVSGKEQLFPTGLGVPQDTETLLSQYNELLLAKKRTLKQATVANPSIKAYDKELVDLLALIRSSLQQTRSQLQNVIGQNNQKIGEDKASILKYPAQERKFRNIERQRNLKESLYLYLLQKREENAITLAVTTPKAKIVNPAYTIGIVKPNAQQIKMLALLAGLAIPLLIIFIINILDTKIRAKEDIEAELSNVPIIAEIPKSDSKPPIINKNDFTVFTESFRMLSTNIKFVLRSKGIKKGGVILITSSIKGEGKTTISINTALTLSGASKVLLIGGDIRNPQLGTYINSESRAKGLTDFLVSDDTDGSNYIVNSGLSDNLDVLFSGSKAPNPNDLLDMDKLGVMIKELRLKYDYIIMDSAPVMLVSDSLHLIDHADLLIYTIKSNFTEKSMLSFVKSLRTENQIQTMAFVINSVTPENLRYGGKYAYGYYDDQSQNIPLLSRVLNKLGVNR